MTVVLTDPVQYTSSFVVLSSAFSSMEPLSRLNLLAPELFFYKLSDPVYKM